MIEEGMVMEVKSLYELSLRAGRQLSRQTQASRDITRGYNAIKAEWDEHMATGYHNGTIVGKNDLAREGAAIELFTELYRELCEAESDKFDAETELMLSKQEIDGIKRDLRLLELLIPARKFDEDSKPHQE